MRKAIAVAALGLFALTCNRAPTTPGSINIFTKSAVNNGAGLKVTWFAAEGTDSYLVYDNSSGTLTVIDTVDPSIQEYTFTTPCTQVAVSTLVGETAGDPTTISLPLTTRSGEIIYSRQDTTSGHLGYFKVTLDSAKVVLYDSAGRSNSYGYLDGPADTVSWYSSYLLFQSDVGLLLAPDTATGFASMSLAPDPSSTVWNGSGELLVPSAYYYLYADEAAIGSIGWSGLDRFGKIRVNSVTGYEVSFDLKVQTSIYALRWLVE